MLIVETGPVAERVRVREIDDDEGRRRRMRATYRRTAGVRHLFAACELGEDKLFGHIKPRKTRAKFQ